MSRVVTMIPTRMASSRLPGKPLLDINGKTMIERVYENVKKVIPGDIYVASGDVEIVKECEKFGAKAILTDPSLPSGTDRIAAALKEIDPKGDKYDIVVNFQGDGINVDPKVNLPLIKMVEEDDCDIATCGKIFKTLEDAQNTTNVKIIMGLKKDEDEARALYFTRALAPFTRDASDEEDEFYHHIGIYVYKASSLAKIVSMPVGILEKREALEQLRALENGMSIKAKIFDSICLDDNAPADINTVEEYEEAIKYIK